MPKRGRPRLTQATTTSDAASRDADNKRHKTARTPQNPFDASTSDAAGPTYTVQRIVAMRFVKGVRQYLVAWEGYAEKDQTWEPMSNLVGCASQIREYEKERERLNKEEQERVLQRRQQAKQQAEQEAARVAEAAGALAEEPGEFEVNEPLPKAHRQKTHPLWACFDLMKPNPSCKLLNLQGKVCGAEPSQKAGTSNFWAHLWTHHREKWYEFKRADGKLTQAGEAELNKLQQALQAAGSTSSTAHFTKNLLVGEAKQTLDRITTEWVVDEDQAFNAASTAGFKRMMSIATNGKYAGCCDKTLKNHVTAMALEGKSEVKAFHEKLLAHGVKPAASGDLWSKNRTALFGLVSHGIERTEDMAADGSRQVTWTMQEKLCGSVPCSKDRHTGEYIGEISDAAWREGGITDPIEQLCARVSDNGANMMKGWDEGFQTPCADHTIELSVKIFTSSPAIEATLEKGRKLVGYFNSSVIGYSEHEIGLHACQELARVPTNTLTQDVKTRWRSSHDMANTLRINQEALLLYDVRNPKAAQGFKDNRYSLEDWQVNNHAVALLAPLAKASKFLEGKKYPTSNLVLPTIYGIILHLEPRSPIKLPWNNEILRPSDLRPEVQAARMLLHEDMVKRWKTDMPEERLRFYSTATLLDPRHKALQFPGSTSEFRATARDWLVSEFESLWIAKAAEGGDEHSGEGFTVRAKKTHAQYEGASFLDFLDQLSHLRQEAATAEDCAENEESEEEVQLEKSEVERYLELPQVSKSADLLQWWAKHESSFPQLSKMAQQYLGCPATSASAERLFSIAGRVFDDLRQGMGEDMLEELMWARINNTSRCNHASRVNKEGGDAIKK